MVLLFTVTDAAWWRKLAVRSAVFGLFVWVPRCYVPSNPIKIIEISCFVLPVGGWRVSSPHRVFSASTLLERFSTPRAWIHHADKRLDRRSVRKWLPPRPPHYSTSSWAETETFCPMRSPRSSTGRIPRWVHVDTESPWEVAFLSHFAKFHLRHFLFSLSFLLSTMAFFLNLTSAKEFLKF